MKETIEMTLRQQVISTALAMNVRGINVGKSGNVSVRGKKGMRDGFYITPSGKPYEQLKPEDIAFVFLRDDKKLEFEGELSPSSEWALHAAVYQTRADAGAVVHTHSPYATALSCQNYAIPAFHYMVAAAGGNSIDVVPYQTFGSQALADAVGQHLQQKKACLMEHHGAVALGGDLIQALDLATEVENLAKQYAVIITMEKPKIISKEEMDVVIEKFKTYGQYPREVFSKRGDQAPEKWHRKNGSLVSCTESVTVLKQNWSEMHDSIQDAFDDAVLLGVSKRAFKQVMYEMIDALECPYDEKEDL